MDISNILVAPKFKDKTCLREVSLGLPDMKTWNERIAAAVAESDYKPQQIAKELGVSPPTVAAWLGAASIRPAKNITGENLLQVCRLLDIRPEWLMFAEQPMRPTTSRKISSEMAKAIDMLVELDSKGGEEREDALYFLNRLLQRKSTISEKQA
jgi:hypothetical protein